MLFRSIKAEFEVPDVNKSNNRKEEHWLTKYNFFVQDIVVSPTAINMNKNDFSIKRDVSINFLAGFKTEFKYNYC